MRTTDTKTEEVEPDKISDPKNKKNNVIHKVLKDGGGLSILKVSATALTAVSMALISSRLTGFINSMILVALVSIGTAVLSEFYRIMLSLTSLGAKKVVAPVLRINADGTTTTAEIEIVQKIDPTEENEQTKRSLIEKAQHYLNRNPIMKIALLFTVVSGLTIGTSYFVSTANERTDVNYTTVHTTNKQELSANEKQEIINSAVTEAESKAKPVIVETATEPIDLTRRITELEKQNKALTDQLKALETAQNNTPVEQNTDNEINDEIIKTLQEQIKTLNSTITDLNDKVTDFESRLKETESKPAAPSQTVVPSQQQGIQP